MYTLITAWGEEITYGTYEEMIAELEMNGMTEGDIEQIDPFTWKDTEFEDL